MCSRTRLLTGAIDHIRGRPATPRCRTSSSTLSSSRRCCARPRRKEGQECCGAVHSLEVQKAHDTRLTPTSSVGGTLDDGGSRGVSPLARRLPHVTKGGRGGETPLATGGCGGIEQHGHGHRGHPKDGPTSLESSDDELRDCPCSPADGAHNAGERGQSSHGEPRTTSSRRS